MYNHNNINVNKRQIIYVKKLLFLTKSCPINSNLTDKVEKWSGTASGNTYVTVDKLAYDSTNKKLGLKVNGADTVIPFSGGVNTQILITSSSNTFNIYKVNFSNQTVTLLTSWNPATSGVHADYIVEGLRIWTRQDTQNWYVYSANGGIYYRWSAFVQKAAGEMVIQGAWINGNSGEVIVLS